MFYIVYFTNGKVDVHNAKAKTFLQVADEQGYSLQYIAYYEEVNDKSTRSYVWINGRWQKK